MPNLSDTLTIQQVSKRAKISKHTLRFWEKALDGIIMPLRTKGGQRRYKLEHLLIIEEVKSLKNKGLSLIEIQKYFRNKQNHGGNHLNSDHVDILANRVAEIVKSAIYNLFETGDLPNRDL
ncbi:MerR family transcriptional regulator [Thermodesulfobacteriota bacterium]